MEEKKEENTYKLLFQMGGLKKLSETDELEMGPVNVFLPRPAAVLCSSSHLN